MQSGMAVLAFHTQIFLKKSKMRFSLICVLAFSKKPSTAVLGDKSGREKHLLHHC